MRKEYRVVESIGPYFNRRFEVQEKYSYYDKGQRKESWHMVFDSTSRERCEEVMKRRQSE